MKPAQDMPKASVLEKIVVNLFTPADMMAWMVCKAIEKVSFGRLSTYTTTEKDSAAREMFSDGGNHFQCKVRSYERLLRLLQDGHNEEITERMARPYMITPCGRIDVLLAKKRGLLDPAHYEELNMKYPVVWNVRKVN